MVVGEIAVGEKKNNVEEEIKSGKKKKGEHCIITGFKGLGLHHFEAHKKR